MKAEDAVRNLQAVTDAEITAAKNPRERERRLREALAAARVAVWMSLELKSKYEANIEVLERRIATMETTINLLREIAQRHGVELPDGLAMYDHTTH
jgi:hypothetical protein